MIEVIGARDIPANKDAIPTIANAPGVIDENIDVVEKILCIIEPSRAPINRDGIIAPTDRLDPIDNVVSKNLEINRIIRVMRVYVKVSPLMRLLNNTSPVPKLSGIK